MNAQKCVRFSLISCVILVALSNFIWTFLRISITENEEIRELFTAAGREEEESIRFVTYLGDESYYPGIVSLVHSLALSMNSTARSNKPMKPPLVAVVPNIIRKDQEMTLQMLGAEVLTLNVPTAFIELLKKRDFSQKWIGAMSKLFILQPIVESDIIFYIDADTVARGDLRSCMDDEISLFRQNRQLDLAAVGNLKYHNNGVFFSRPSERLFNYMVDLLTNGTCTAPKEQQDGAGDNTTINTTTSASSSSAGPVRNELVSATCMGNIYTDQDLFVEYTHRFPERFRAIRNPNAINMRPMHEKIDKNERCSIVHFIGHPKPWDAWFNQSIAVSGPNVAARPLLPLAIIPDSIHQIVATNPEKIRLWSLTVWRDIWNQAMMRLTETELKLNCRDIQISLLQSNPIFC